jgi:hypothetical protein
LQFLDRAFFVHLTVLRNRVPPTDNPLRPAGLGLVENTFRDTSLKNTYINPCHSLQYAHSSVLLENWIDSNQYNRHAICHHWRFNSSGMSISPRAASWELQ